MPIQPWTNPAIAKSYEKHFDESLHGPNEPRPNQPGFQASERMSAGEMFGPTAVCDFCGCWQRLDLSSFDPNDQTAPAERMRQLGWTNHQGQDACPRH